MEHLTASSENIYKRRIRANRAAQPSLGPIFKRRSGMIRQFKSIFVGVDQIFSLER